MTGERKAGLGALGLLAALLCWNVVFLSRDCGSLRPWGAGDRAPDFSAARLDQPGQGSLAALKGQVVLVDFWATWCGPCLKSMPAVERLWQRHKSEGFTVMSLNIEGARKAHKALAFAQAFEPPLTFPLYIDDGAVKSLYRVNAIPHMVLVDKQGMVREVHVGQVGEGMEQELDQEIVDLLRR